MAKKETTESAPKLTPMFKQYMAIKAEYPDALLFYRMGDFYELFFEDAETAGRELQIAVTSRSPGPKADAPMCGVPHHAVEPYLAQLLDKGYKVAICDQVEDPKQAKGLVKREVTRILTPGTVVEDSNLTAKSHNYLGAVIWNEAKGTGGLAWVDISTGEWSGLQSKRSAELWQWAAKMAPRELLLADEAEVPAGFGGEETYINRIPARAYFDLGAAKDKVLKAQSASSLDVLDLDDKDELVRCLGALLTYLFQTQKRELVHLGQFRPLNLGKHLLLDEVTERNLEIFRRLDGRKGRGTLWNVVDRTMTPMGGRLLEERLRHPWRDLAPVNETHDAVEWLWEDDSLRRDLRAALDRVYDLERLSTRIFLNRANPKDFAALRESLAALPDIHRILETATALRTPARAIKVLVEAWDNLGEYHALLSRALVDSPPTVITEGGLFRTGFHADLDELLELTEHGEGMLRELQTREQEATGIPKLKLGHNRVFGYYFEVSKVNAGLVPDHFIRRQTLANAERFTTTELKELEEKVVSASDKRKTMEYNLFLELRQTIAEARPRFLYMADAVAGLDYWQGLAEVARQWNWTRPEMHAGTRISISQGRHPVVEAVQGTADFIPNDLLLDEDRKILLITGPNMAGKSTVLRQSALICILAQIGSFVPASKAELGLCDRVFSRVGASDNLAQGQSTFMVEMTETARILRQAGKRSLVILDEIGRGTSTFDGLALAWAVVEELSKRGRGGIRTLFATHYHELTSLEGVIDGVRNMNIAVKEWGGEIVFLRRLVPGPADRSYGIEVARLAGVPQSVVQRARQILGELEKKAREANERLDIAPSQQTLLPGFALVMKDSDKDGKPAENTVAADEPHPLLEELGALRADNLTPIEALNILHRWKAEWGTGQ